MQRSADLDLMLRPRALENLDTGSVTSLLSWSQTELKDKIARIEAETRKAVAGLGQLDSTLRSGLRPALAGAATITIALPGVGTLVTLGTAAVAWWVYDNLELIQAKVAEILDRARALVQRSTPVLGLATFSFAWLNEVMKPLSNIEYYLDKPADNNLDQWQGRAAEGYRRVNPIQKSAVGDVKKKADLVSKWLLNIMASNIAYAQKLLDFVTKTVELIVRAAENAATVVGAPSATDNLAEAVNGIVVEAIKMAQEIVTGLVKNVQEFRDMTGSFADEANLPGGRWPNSLAPQFH